MPFETLEYRFFDLTQVAFWDGQEAENELKVTSEPLKHRFSTSNRILGRSRGRKCVQSAMRALETSHNGLVRRKKISSQCQATT